MIKEIFGIAGRNILRNRRRTILNMIALIVGMSIMIASIGWVRGYFTTLYNGMIRLDTGHIQVVHQDYLDEERRLPLDLLVEDYHSIRSRLAENDFVQTASGRIQFELELGNGREYMPMRGRAVDPQYETAVTDIQKYLVDGEYLGSGNDAGVMLGSDAADLLDVEVGDAVYVRVRDRFGAPNTAVLNLTGIFSTGYPLFDRYTAVSELAWTADFLRLSDAVTHIVIRLEHGSPESAVESLQDDLPGQMQAYPWRRFAQTMIALVEADIGSFVILMGILFLLILLGILNSMSMAVRERGREIGTMRAIGLKRRNLHQMLLAESVVIGVISAAAAAVIGGGFAAYVQFVGFDVAQFMPPDLPVPFGDRFYGDYRLSDFLVSAAVGIGSAMLGTLLPARRAVRLNIVDTMRSGTL
ncbi:MAG: ABC transporter permease [Spirochaeta sp.]